MEQLIRNLFGDWGLLIIPFITGVLTSFPIEALNYYRPSEEEGLKNKKNFLKYVLFKPKISNSLITLFFTVLIMFVFKSYYTNGAEILLFLILNFATAIIFYNIGGKKVVGIIVTWFLNKFSSRLDKTNI